MRRSHNFEVSPANSSAQGREGSRLDDSVEARFQLLIESVTDYGIFILDPQGHIASWNTGAQKSEA